MTIRRPMLHPVLHACRLPMHSSLQQQASGGTAAAQQSPPPPARHHLPAKTAQLSAHRTAHLLWQLACPHPPPLPCPALLRPVSSQLGEPPAAQTALKHPLYETVWRCEPACLRQTLQTGIAPS